MMEAGLERVDNDTRWKQRFTNFENAYIVFRRALERHEADPDDEIIQMGLVQAFEFTYELAWNTIFDFVAYPTITNEALKAHIDRKGHVLFNKNIA
jgi:hypothetical protein